MSNSITAPITVVQNVISAPINTAARDAYQLAVAGGFVGTRAEWLASLNSADLVSATPPTSPVEGMRWFSSVTGLSYTYFDGVWVSNSAGPAYVAHADKHAAGGEDPITPASIGASASTHDHAGVYEPTGTASAAVAAHASATDPHGDRAYADSLVIGLVDDRGNFDASVNTFPTTGGSGTAGAILKGDLWTISVVASSGPLVSYQVGCLIRSLADAPGQTAANWSITAVGFGYSPENSANKSSDVATDQASTSKYPTVKALYDWAVGMFATAAQGLLAASSVQVTGDQEIDGAKTFTGSARPAAPNVTGAPAEGDLITRSDAALEDIFNVYFSRVITVFGGNSSGTTGSTASRSGSSPTGWGRFIISSSITGYSATGNTVPRCNKPIAIAMHGVFHGSDVANTARTRFLVGDAASGTPPNAASPPLSGRGFGFEIYWSTINARIEGVLFAHDGTTLTYGTPFSWGLASYAYERSVICSTDGNGNVRLYMSNPAATGALHTRPALVSSTTGGPTGTNNSYAGNTASILTLNDGTNAPAADALVSGFQQAIILLNHPEL